MSGSASFVVSLSMAGKPMVLLHGSTPEPTLRSLPTTDLGGIRYPNERDVTVSSQAVGIRIAEEQTQLATRVCAHI
jgi:hypothetical protein